MTVFILSFSHSFIANFVLCAVKKLLEYAETTSFRLDAFRIAVCGKESGDARFCCQADCLMAL